jgi:small ligand-binding sensory domain FIST
MVRLCPARACRRRGRVPGLGADSGGLTRAPSVAEASSERGGGAAARAGAGRWGPSHGPSGGIVSALVVAARSPSTVYASTLGAGVFKSVDGGRSWRAVNAGLTTTRVDTLALDPQTPATVYSGTGRGVFKSTNGGRSWHAANAGPKSRVLALALDPQNAATLYAGTEAGVARSTDGGLSWRAFNNGLTALGVKTLPTVEAIAVDSTGRAPLRRHGRRGRRRLQVPLSRIRPVGQETKLGPLALAGDREGGFAAARRRLTEPMRIGAGMSTSLSGGEAAAVAAREAARSLEGRSADLAFLFLSQQHLAVAEEAASAVREQLAPRNLVGCVAQGVLARSRELEEGPGAAVWAASLPGAEIDAFHAADSADLPELDAESLALMLVDPFTFPVADALAELNGRSGAGPVVGGVAVAAGEPGAQALIVDADLHEGGAAGAVVSGVPVCAVVSQGCAPFGREAVITRAEGNLVFELAGERALDRLRAEIVALPAEQQLLAAKGVLAGLVIDENKAEYGRGDYLMRGILGADESEGALAIGEHMRVGQTLRFHFRDAASADDDLRDALTRELGGRTAAGALLFTCNGRGTQMFAESDHDARTVSDLLGSPGVAGFFCGGEIGPVGGRLFLHGFTATLAVFLHP